MIFALGTGSTFPSISYNDIASLQIDLPPLAEQKRIVAKVDELMALCDRLEAQQQERETRHAALALASLARFAEVPTPSNLEYLFHPSYSIPPADLRKSILTLAVQGKLVPQDSNDEPAEELLAKIECDRSGLAKKQGVRPPKNVPPLTADNYPHDIPKSWRWSRIGHLAHVVDYGTSQKADNDSAKVPVYRMGNIVGGRLVDENLKYVDASIDDLPGLYLKTHDILFNRTNSYELVGKAGIYKGPDNAATFASYLIRIRLPSALLFPAFYSLAMNAPYYRQTQIEPEVVQQCGQANFNGTKLASTVVPIPPLAEQRRIVAKVEQLMALVDALETQLAASRATAANLLSALVAELTGTRHTGKVSVPATTTTGRRGRPRKSA
jgi:type I restriction enzyme S subunit